MELDFERYQSISTESLQSSEISSIQTNPGEQNTPSRIPLQSSNSRALPPAKSYFFSA
jgi:hypothetical protein